MKNTSLTRLLSFGIQMMTLLLVRASMAQDAPIMSLAKAPALKEDLKLSDKKFSAYTVLGGWDFLFLRRKRRRGGFRASCRHTVFC